MPIRIHGSPPPHSTVFPHPCAEFIQSSAKRIEHILFYSKKGEKGRGRKNVNFVKYSKVYGSGYGRVGVGISWVLYTAERERDINQKDSP